MYIYIHTYIYTRERSTTRGCVPLFILPWHPCRALPLSPGGRAARVHLDFHEFPAKRRPHPLPNAMSRADHLHFRARFTAPLRSARSRRIAPVTRARTLAWRNRIPLAAKVESGRAHNQPVSNFSSVLFFFFLKRVKIFLFSFVKLLRFDYFAA